MDTDWANGYNLGKWCFPFYIIRLLIKLTYMTLACVMAPCICGEILLLPQVGLYIINSHSVTAINSFVTISLFMLCTLLCWIVVNVFLIGCLYPIYTFTTTRHSFKQSVFDLYKNIKNELDEEAAEHNG